MKFFPLFLKFFFSIFSLLMLASASYGAVDTGALETATELYYTMDNANVSGTTILDKTPNGNDGTINGATTGVSGILNEAFSFSGGSNVVGSFISMGGDSKFAVSLWVQPNQLSTTQMFLTGEGSGAERYPDIFIDNNNKIQFGTNNIDARLISTSTLTTGQYYHIMAFADGLSRELYINGVLEASGNSVNIADFSNNGIRLGERGDNTLPANVEVDEVVILNSFYTTAGTAEELAEYYYNSGAPTSEQQYPYSSGTPTGDLFFQNITLNGAKFQNNSFMNTTELNFNTILNSSNNNTNTNITAKINEGDYLNETNFSNPIKFFGNINRNIAADNPTAEQYCIEQRYDGFTSYTSQSSGSTPLWAYTTGWGTKYGDRINSLTCYSESFLFGTNTLNGTFNITLATDTYNIAFFGINNETSASTGNYTLTIDTTPPTITNNIPTEINSYFFNDSQFSCTDTNLGDCYILINSQNLTPSENATLTLNGNLSYEIIAEDNAGNTIEETGTIFVNPLQRFQFEDTQRSLLVSNYSFGQFEEINTILEFPLYDLGIGTHTLLFEKKFYDKENFTFTFTNTSNLNLTFNISPTDITLEVFDEENYTQIDFNLTIEDSNGNIQSFNNQDTFNQLSTNLSSGELIFRINKPTYDERKLFVTNEPFTAVSISTMLLKSDISTPVIFEILDARTRDPIDNVDLVFKRIVSGELRTAGEARTDSQGLTFFNMDSLAEYEITIFANGYSTQTFTTIPGKTEYTLLLNEEDVIDEFFFDQLSYNIFPNTYQQIPFYTTATVVDNKNLINSYRYSVTGDNTSFTQIKTDATGGEITFQITNYSQEYLLNLTIIRDGQERSFTKILRDIEETNSNFSITNASDNFLNDDESPANRIMFMVFIYILFMVTGAVLGGIATGGTAAASTGAMAGIIPIMFFVFAGFINIGIGGLIIMATVLGVYFFRQ